MAGKVELKNLMRRYKRFLCLGWGNDSARFMLEEYQILKGRKCIGYLSRITEKCKGEEREVEIQSSKDVYTHLQKIKDLTRVDEEMASILSQGSVKELNKLKYFNWTDILDSEIEEKLYVHYFGDRKAPESFEDYPRKVQKKAEKVIEAAKKGEIDLFRFFDKIIGKRHIGDKYARRLILLSIASLFVENANPVHQVLKGETGSGKTDLILTAVELIPERFVHIIRSSSPRYLFYDSENGEGEARDDYNIYVFDDVKISEDIIDVAKYITDNRLKDKVHRTVKEQTATKLKIPGKGLCFFTRAEDIPDPELNSRLLYNNPREDKEHKKRVIEKIMHSTKERKEYEDLVPIARAVFEKLIEHPINVWNPWLRRLKMNEDEKMVIRDRKMFENLVKGMTLFRQFQREPVPRADWIQGTREDVEDVLKLWEKIELLERYKLDRKKIELLKLLEPYSEEKMREYYDAYDATPADFLADDEVPTYQNLANKLGTNKERIRDWVTGRRYTRMPGLMEQGLVEVRQVDPKVRTSPHVLFLSPHVTKEEIRNSNNKKIRLRLPSIFELNDGGIEDREKREILYELPLNKDLEKDGEHWKEKLVERMRERRPEPLESDDEIREFVIEAKDEARKLEGEIRENKSTIDVLLEELERENGKEKEGLDSWREDKNDEDDDEDSGMPTSTIEKVEKEAESEEMGEYESLEDEEKHESEKEKETPLDSLDERILRTLEELRKGGPVSKDTLAKNLSEAPDGEDIPKIKMRIDKLILKDLIVEDEEAPGMLKTKNENEDTKDKEDNEEPNRESEKERLKKEIISHVRFFEERTKDEDEFLGCHLSDLAMTTNLSIGEVDKLVNELVEEGKLEKPFMDYVTTDLSLIRLKDRRPPT